jgi:menaquinone-dependent protoporphyrinogen oxidase
MTRTLVAYASKHGSTEEVARAIAARLRADGQDVDVLPAASAAVAGTAGYDCVVLGGSLYMGRWHADARRFLRRHGGALERLPLAVFALGPLNLEEDQVAGSRKQLDGALGRLGVEPKLVAIFGGVVEPEKLRFPFSRMAETDARDWQAIDAWADEVAALHGCLVGVPA